MCATFRGELQMKIKKAKASVFKLIGLLLLAPIMPVSVAITTNRTRGSQDTMDAGILSGDSK